MTINHKSIRLCPKMGMGPFGKITFDPFAGD